MQTTFGRRTSIVARATLVRTCCAVVIFHVLVGPAQAADAVTEWTLEADRLGEGGANWHTLAIMQMAMHDAYNAAHPVYARWTPPSADEPSGEGASPEAALAGAAAQVLVSLHPEHQREIGAVFRNAISLLQPGPGVAAGVKLGEEVGVAAVAHRAHDGYHLIHVFAAHDQPGRWRPVPPDMATSNTTAAQPFLFSTRTDFAATPPPALGSNVYLRDVAEIRRMGALEHAARSDEQSYAATYWAYQSSQRGFMRLAVNLLDAAPRPGGLAEHARIMSQLSVALADSAIMIWGEKERFSFWRPITVIREGGFGVTADSNWQPFIETPPHPEYPSGHASDCFTGAWLLTSAFGVDFGSIDYVAQSGMPQAETAAIGMGQHAQIGNLAAVARRFPSLSAAAQECSRSRIWAGAHFRSADEEASRLAREIVARAIAAVPLLPRR